MEFLVDFDMNIPEGMPEAEIKKREDDEASAVAELADKGHVLRIWKQDSATGKGTVLGLYRADSKLELDRVLNTLPLHDWMKIAVTPLLVHPNDPGIERRAGEQGRPVIQLPAPKLTFVYRVEAALGQPVELGETEHGRRRIVPQTGGTFTGPALSGTLLAGASADWQIVKPDGTVLVDIRYTLQTDQGAVLYVQSQGVRHGSPEVLSRLGRGEEVDASEYTFRTSTRIETTAPELDWLNKGVFVSVGGRQSAGVIYETYLVG